jgi:hypothetical protein
MVSKKCTKCSKELSLDNFGNKKNSPDGLNPWCKNATKIMLKCIEKTIKIKFVNHKTTIFKITEIKFDNGIKTISKTIKKEFGKGLE